jgi:hypothetical protein
VARPVEVKIDLRAFNTWARAAISRQVPFAVAKALTRCAVLARDEVRADLPEHFTIRSSWVAKGIQAVPAKKSDWPHPHAVVGVRDQFMELQETGGTKVATKGTPSGPARVAVPGNLVVRQRTSGGRIPKRLKPRVILDTKKAYKGADAILLSVRKGEGENDRNRLLYLLREQTHLKPRFEFRKTVAGAMRAVWGEYFSQALTEALATPKKP